MWPELALLVVAAAGPTGYLGSPACAECHADVARVFADHPMRTGSGPVRDAPLPALRLPGLVEHAASGVTYRVDRTDAGGLVVDYERRDPERPLRGRISVSHFVGGKKGLSFLHERDGYLYQVPVSFYHEGARWRASPGYEEAAAIPLSRPTQVVCVECHFSGAAPVAGTSNRFEAPPYGEGGVGCERCHGPGGAHRDHVRRGGRAPWQIVNPGRLAPEARDSVCAQCHLQGASRVHKEGCGLSSFRPGGLLGEVAADYVWSGGRGPLDQTSHFQKLRQSTCHQRSEGRLGCISCHDPHRKVPASERVAHFRGRCQQCHEHRRCTAPVDARRARGDDCVACHMPRAGNETVVHAVTTDHSIPRRPGPRAEPETRPAELVPFWGGAAPVRELGIAYFSLATERERWRSFAEEQLRRAFGEGARDATVLILLGTSLEAAGSPERALPLYEQGVRAEGGCADVLAVGENRLGALLAARGRVPEAVRLFEQSLGRTPVYEAARANLARARAALGERERALSVLREGLVLEPDSAALRGLLRSLDGPS